jgi:Caspase domain
MKHLRVANQIAGLFALIAVPCVVSPAEPPGVTWLEIPSQSLRVDANEAALLKPGAIPLVNVHLGRQPQDVAYAKITTRLNAEVANIVTTQRAGEDGIICSLDLSSNPSLMLKPGRNSVEVTYVDRRNEVHYTSFMLQLPSDKPAAPVRRLPGHPGERPEPSGRRYALVVGVGKYKLGGSGLQNLAYADSDAAAFQQFLIHGGAIPKENVQLLLNDDATLEAIKQRLTVALSAAGPEDTVILYFNMQGAYDPSHPDRKYLAAYDTDPLNMAETALSVADLPDLIANSVHSKHIVLLADTCHGNGVGIDVTVKTKPDNLVNLYLVRAMQLRGMAAIEASDIHQISHEGQQWKGAGAFTYDLIQGLSGKADLDGDGTVTVNELFTYTQLQVAKDTFDDQLPITSSPTFGNLALAGVLSARKSAAPRVGGD